MRKDERGELSRELFEQNIVDEIHSGKLDSVMIEIEVAMLSTSRPT